MPEYDDIMLFGQDEESDEETVAPVEMEEVQHTTEETMETECPPLVITKAVHIAEETHNHHFYKWIILALATLLVAGVFGFSQISGESGLNNQA